MKKLMFLFIAITALLWAFQPEANAQVISLNPNQIWESYTGAAGDTAKSTTAKNFDIYVAKKSMYYYDIQVSADSSGDGTNFSVQLSGSNDNSNWYTVGSAQTWAVSSTDTIMRFTNMSSVSTSTSIAATSDYVERTLATTFDYVERTYEEANIYHAYDSATGVSDTWVDTVTVASYAVADTITLGERVIADTITVGARTITETLTESSVGWRYIRVGFTGAGAGARMELGGITVAIRPKLFSF